MHVGQAQVNKYEASGLLIIIIKSIAISCIITRCNNVRDPVSIPNMEALVENHSATLTLILLFIIIII